jgi:hypothetical protein
VQQPFMVQFQTRLYFKSHLAYMHCYDLYHLTPKQEQQIQIQLHLQLQVQGQGQENNHNNNNNNNVFLQANDFMTKDDKKLMNYVTNDETPSPTPLSAAELSLIQQMYQNKARYNPIFIQNNIKHREKYNSIVPEPDTQINHSLFLFLVSVFRCSLLKKQTQKQKVIIMMMMNRRKN